LVKNWVSSLLLPRKPVGKKPGFDLFKILIPLLVIFRYNGQVKVKEKTRPGPTIPLVICLPLAFHASGPNIMLWGMVAVLLAILPALMVWLAYRR
jgi:hypothetical protein